MKTSLLIIVLSAIALAGCSGVPNSGSEQSAPTTTATNPPISKDVTSSTSPTATTEPASGPLAISCTGTSYGVVLLGPTAKQSVYGTVQEPNGSPTFNCGESFDDIVVDDVDLVSARYRQIFSPDYNVLAYNWRDPSNQSERVGYVDARTGEVTDVTALVAGDSAFSKSPRHRNALFAPDGSFFFMDERSRSFNWFDPETKTVVKTLPFKYDNDDMHTWSLGLDGEPETSADKIRTSDPALVLYPYGEVLNWFDETKALVIQDGKLGILNPVPVDGKEPGTFLAVTPSSDFEISSAVADPAKENIFFIGGRGEESFLFSVPADGSSEPKRIRPLEPQDGQLLIAYYGD